MPWRQLRERKGSWAPLNPRWISVDSAEVAQEVTNTTVVEVVGIAAPVGAIVMWGKSVPPTGWLIADGSAISRTTYADLFGILGTTFGAGNGSTTFNIPDLSDRFPGGKGATLGSIAATGGTFSHSHAAGSYDTGAQSQGHTHSVSGTTASEAAHSHTMGTHAHTANGNPDATGDQEVAGGAESFASGSHGHGNTSSVDPGNTNSAGSHTHGAGTLDTAGVSQGHTHGVSGSSGTANPPFVALAFIIKT